MEILKLGDDFAGVITKAAEVLHQGGVIIYPTDTLYGLGADALSDRAIEKVYAIKARDEGKPLHCVVANLEMAAEYAIVNDAARKLAEKFLPGPLTMILRKRDEIDPALSRGRTEFAIRIPDNQFCLELARIFGKPYTTTSANKSGKEPQMTVENIIEQLGADAADLCIDAGPAPRAKPSTIVNLAEGYPTILREGAIPAADILTLF